MPNPEKILVLVRHAHRDTVSKKADNGLSPKGQKQALRLEVELASKFEEKPLLISSPKKRCIETLEPLAEKLGQEVDIEPLLDEESPNEKSADFLDRIKAFANWWKTQAPKITIACSHGDWLPETVGLITGREADFVKSGWLLLTLESNGKVLIQESSANRDY
jgi:broad specificity phosphatase PhoE